MERNEVILSTTQIDRQNEKFSVDALESMVEQIKSSLYPMGVEHDPRIPPVGRIVDARLRERDDGEYEVVGIVEMFDSPESDPPSVDGRTFPVREPKSKTPQLIYDRSYRDDEDQKTIEEVADILDSRPIEEGKKSYEVLSALTIAGSFALGGIASGFFKSLGEDAYEALKSKIKELLDRKKSERDEYLFRFNPTIEIDDRLVEIDVILTNPSEDDIESFFEDGIPELDNVIPGHVQNENVKKVVYEYEDKSVTVKFGVRKDCVPLTPVSPDS